MMREYLEGADLKDNEDILENLDFLDQKVKKEMQGFQGSREALHG